MLVNIIRAQPSSRAVWHTLFLALALPACSDTAGAGEDLGGRGGSDLEGTISHLLRAEARPDPYVATIAYVDLEITGIERFSIEYGPSSEYGMETPSYAVEGDTMSIMLLCLQPGAEHHYRVIGTTADGQTLATDEQTVTTSSASFFDPGFETLVPPDESEEGYLLLGVPLGMGMESHAYLIDLEGNVCWYRPMGSVFESGLDVQRHPNGNLVVYQSDTNFFEEIGHSGAVVHEWRGLSESQTLNGHHITFVDEDRTLLLGYSASNGQPYDTFEIVDRNGIVHFSYGTNTIGDGADSLHPNSIVADQDGNVMVSLRNVDSVILIDRSGDNILWRLGGEWSDFTFVDDDFGGFSQQHDASLLPNGDVMLFDNGNEHNPPVSRVVRYRLDHEEKTATLVWEVRHEPDLFCEGGASAQYLDNGNTLIGWSLGGVVTMVDPDGQVLWEIRTLRGVFYRAHWMPTLYGP